MRTDLSSAVIDTPEFSIEIKGQPVYDRIDGPHHRIDFELAQKVPDDAFSLEPHGLVGQSFDGDGVARTGAIDVYPPRNVTAEFTTSAMAEGAIDGVPSDYKVGTRYETRFEYSAFGAFPSAEMLNYEPWWTRRHRRLRAEAERAARKEARRLRRLARAGASD